MNTRRMVVVVLMVLLMGGLCASLALAQDSPVPLKAHLTRSDGEINETILRATGKTESEPNNKFGDANPINVGDVIQGSIGQSGDSDYYRIRIPADTYYMALFDIDAYVNGSALDPVICLYDRDRTELACNDDANWLDSLLFHELNPAGNTPGGPYYLRVRDFYHPNAGGPDYTYTLSVYRPLLISANRSGTVAGIRFDSSDVLAYYQFPDGHEKWMMFFDGSDMGITTNVVGLSAGHHGFQAIQLVLKAADQLWVGGSMQTVTPYDVLIFEMEGDISRIIHVKFA